MTNKQSHHASSHLKAKLSVILVEKEGLGGCPGIESLLRKSWFWPDFPILFVKEPAICLKKSKNHTQNSFPSLRLLFSDSLLGEIFLDKFPSTSFFLRGK
jgi:hypothetical protein